MCQVPRIAIASPTSDGEEKCFFIYWEISWLRPWFWEALGSAIVKVYSAGGWRSRRISTICARSIQVTCPSRSSSLKRLHKVQCYEVWAAAIHILKYTLCYHEHFIARRHFVFDKSNFPTEIPILVYSSKLVVVNKMFWRYIHLALIQSTATTNQL